MCWDLMGPVISLQVNNGQGSVRHSGETREEWNRAVSKIGRDFLIKEVRLCNSLPDTNTVRNGLLPHWAKICALPSIA